MNCSPTARSNSYRFHTNSMSTLAVHDVMPRPRSSSAVLGRSTTQGIKRRGVYKSVKTLVANYGKDISDLRSDVSKLDSKLNTLMEQHVQQTNKLQTDLFKGGRILQNQVSSWVENDISKAIKEFSKELLPIKKSLEQQRKRTEEVLQGQRVTAAVANLIIGGGIMALFVGQLLNILPDILSRLSRTLGSPQQVFKIGILSFLAVVVCSLLLNVIWELTIQSVLNLKATWTNGRKRNSRSQQAPSQPQEL